MKYRILYLVLFAFPLSVHAAGICEIGKESNDIDTLGVMYRGSTSVPYSDARPRPFSMIVFHDPGSSQCDTSAMLAYGQTYDKKRDGMFGYHFYIARDGTIYQGAPLTKRTNHVSGSYRRTKLQYSNSSAIGISLMCGHMKIPEAQLNAAVRLGHLLQVAYAVPSNRIFGHGELQFNRLPNEGIVAARATRTTSAFERDAVEVKKSSANITCAVAGAVPSPCVGGACEVFSSVPQKTIDGLPPGLYKILTNNSGYEIPKTSLPKGTRIPLPKTKDGGSQLTIDGSLVDTDSRAWGYGQKNVSRPTSSVDTSTQFSNPLNTLKFK